eukprot:SAG22_NODE_2017_length_3130_cov_9.400198_3_plen_97_part_00
MQTSLPSNRPDVKDVMVKFPGMASGDNGHMITLAGPSQATRTAVYDTFEAWRKEQGLGEGGYHLKGKDTLFEKILTYGAGLSTTYYFHSHLGNQFI